MSLPVTAALRSPDRVLQSVAQWLDGYVSRPSGPYRPMCVRSRAAIANNLIQLERRASPLSCDSAYINEINEILLLYRKLKPHNGILISHFSVLFCYEYADLGLLTESCRNEKANFLSQKLLLGKFHPDMPLHALDDKSHWFLPTPYPVLALRQLIQEDARFLTQNREVDDRANLVAVYKKVFSD